jgi:hypothetical protein
LADEINGGQAQGITGGGDDGDGAERLGYFLCQGIGTPRMAAEDTDRELGGLIDNHNGRVEILVSRKRSKDADDNSEGHDTDERSAGAEKLMQRLPGGCLDEDDFTATKFPSQALSERETDWGQRYDG